MTLQQLTNVFLGIFGDFKEQLIFKITFNSCCTELIKYIVILLVIIGRTTPLRCERCYWAIYWRSNGYVWIYQKISVSVSCEIKIFDLWCQISNFINPARSVYYLYESWYAKHNITNILQVSQPQILQMTTVKRERSQHHMTITYLPCCMTWSYDNYSIGSAKNISGAKESIENKYFLWIDCQMDKV